MIGGLIGLGIIGTIVFTVLYCRFRKAKSVPAAPEIVIAEPEVILEKFDKMVDCDILNIPDQPESNE